MVEINFYHLQNRRTKYFLKYFLPSHKVRFKAVDRWRGLLVNEIMTEKFYSKATVIVEGKSQYYSINMKYKEEKASKRLT